jgi:hypothetical protein
MSINRSQIAHLLKPGLKTIVGQYPTYPDEWTEIYTSYTSDKAQEVDMEMKYLGLASIKGEGQPVSSDSMGERIVTSYLHKTISLSFSITKEAMEDNLYKSQFPMQAVSLNKSLRTTKNVLGANVLNNAFNANYPTGDGQPICSVNHPIDGGVFANTLAVPTAFSQAALQQLLIVMQKMPMQSGILAQTKAQKLIIPPELQFEASVVLNSTFQPATANNAINPINYNSYIPKGYKVNNFLTNPTAYFILTDAPDGFKHFQRRPIETDTYADYMTEIVQCKATERYSMGITNTRACVGNIGA